MRKILFVSLFSLICLSGYAADQLQIAALLDTSRSVPPKDFLKAKETIRALVEQAPPVHP